ncbi:zinc-dependent peptidase [Chitinophaga pendula]|uniref:M90 family metallopeptidase n=1 Tax=Chitinophaga TaxID=79328 RepID=UPI000BB0B1F0|nr:MULTISPECIES: M90 family metallopeptidase [Chitinophaga]ASZ15015.1 peptidase [Chitinophaga sp. MD30]UCJ09498.1 zinc-dependent peptidase [Chitinophaga pendula]
MYIGAYILVGVMTVLFTGLLFLYVRHYLKRWQRQRVAVPGNDELLLARHVKYYQQLDQPAKTRFAQLVRQFLHHTTIEGVGVEVESVDRILIAASAVIPVFGFPSWKYTNLTNVILYPDTFDEQYQFEGDRRNILGMVGSGTLNGQMVLSRQALRHGYTAESGTSNTGIHEFVHLLDKSDGIIDGFPRNFLEHRYSDAWQHIIQQETQNIEEGTSDINPYAATRESEFLAVAAEYFFQEPARLKAHHPALYGILGLIFNQEPAY